MNPPARILVVDDEESMRFFLRRALSRRGFAVETASDGPGGLEKFRTMKPDAVLLDVRLPGLGGKEILESIRAQNSTIPVILMTGYATVDDAMAAMWSGATDYVRKPLKADDVAGALERALVSRGGAPLPSNTVRTLAGPGAVDATSTPRTRPSAPPGDPLAWLRSELASRRLAGLDDTGDALPPLHEAVRLFESLYVDELMRRSAGNVARASRAAGVTRPNFHRKLRSLGLDAGRYRGSCPSGGRP